MMHKLHLILFLVIIILTSCAEDIKFKFSVNSNKIIMTCSKNNIVFQDLIIARDNSKYHEPPIYLNQMNTSLDKMRIDGEYVIDYRSMYKEFDERPFLIEGDVYSYFVSIGPDRYEGKMVFNNGNFETYNK